MTASPIRRSPMHRGAVIATDELTPRMRRITVLAESVDVAALRPAQDIELWLTEQSGRRVKRRYTIRHARPNGELDLDVLVHGHGPGSAWAAAVASGDEVEFQGPRGKLELTSATWHLLVGDESALPAIAAICEALDEPAFAVIEVEGRDDELPVLAQTTFVHRGATAAGGAELLADAVSTMPMPTSAGHGYLMGETRAMVALRGVLEERGFAHENVFVKGYWNLGRPDRLAGRSPAADS